MSKIAISKILVGKGQELFESPRIFVEYANNFQADSLINDLENFPHAFALACVMDRQIKAELAWRIPHEIAKKLGNFEFQTLANLSLNQIEDLMINPNPLHRFPKDMANNFFLTVQRIKKKYTGKASNIWTTNLSSAEVVYRFLEFRGVGQKIATMATNILARDFKIPFSDYYSIDVSVDTHVKRVFSRLGLVPPQATNEHIIFRARALSPEFPGLLDLPLWEIGRNWCKASKDPECSKCIMNNVCPKIL